MNSLLENTAVIERLRDSGAFLLANGRITQAGDLSIEAREHASLDLPTWLKGLGGCEGWLCGTSSVTAWPGNLPEGVLLSAELAIYGNSDLRSSVHLRRIGNRWLETKLEDRVHPHGKMRGIDTVHPSTEPRTAAMRYRTWWHRVEAGPQGDRLKVWQPYASRFLGWGEVANG